MSRTPVAFVAALALVAGALTLTWPASAGSVPSDNLLTGDTATLASAGSWRTTGTNEKVNARSWPDGTRSLTLTSEAATPVQAGTGSQGVRAIPGAVYAGRLEVRATDVTATTFARLSWYDGQGAEITVDRVTGYAVADRADGWNAFRVSGRAPATAAFVALGLQVAVTGGGQTHDLARPTLTVSTGGSPALTGPLRTSGNQVLDSRGNQVVLRGLNRSGHYDRARPTNFTAADVAMIKAWGSNVVRLTLGQQLWLPGCPSYDAGYRSAIDDAVQWVTEAGMVAVLDLQWNAPTCDSAGQNPLADARSLVFWRQVADRYRSNPLVAFDLFNEPHSVSDQAWRDGGPATSTTGATYLGVGMKALYDAVRGTGATNLILVGGLGRASLWPSTAPLAGTVNVVYAVHAYNCAVPADCTFGTGSSYLLDRFLVAGKTVPIMVSEFGWPTGSAPQGWAFTNGVIAYAEQQGWSWAAWDWSRTGTCAATLHFSVIAPGTCGPGGTHEPAVAGQPILEGLTRNR